MQHPTAINRAIADLKREPHHPFAITVGLLAAISMQIERSHSLHHYEIIGVQNVSANNWTVTFTCTSKSPGLSVWIRLAHFRWIESGEGVTNAGLRLVNDIIVS